MWATEAEKHQQFVIEAPFACMGWNIVECGRERDEDGYQYAKAVHAVTGEEQVFHHPDAVSDAISFVHYGNQTAEERSAWLEPFGLGWQEEQEERRTGMTRDGERA